MIFVPYAAWGARRDVRTAAEPVPGDVITDSNAPRGTRTPVGTDCFALSIAAIAAYPAGLSPHTTSANVVLKPGAGPLAQLARLPPGMNIT